MFRPSKRPALCPLPLNTLKTASVKRGDGRLESEVGAGDCGAIAVSTPTACAYTAVKQRIKVVVRVRPMLPADEGRCYVAEQIKTCVVPGASTALGQEVVLSRELYPERRFVTDRVLGPDTTQVESFEGIVRPVLDDLFLGFNGSIMCYGQTGSGKTHTMFGKCPKWSEPRDDMYTHGGFVPQAAVDVFTRVLAQQSEAVPVFTTVTITFLELYMERVVDLLGHGGKLAVREDPKAGVFVEGLTEVAVSSCDQLLSVIAEGVKRRACHSTRSNAHSSRSHAILTIHIQQRSAVGSRTDGGELSVKQSCLTFVDLAGSERVAKTGTKGVRLEEAKTINKSVSALGNCIAALADQIKLGREGHVPLRDSVLTRLLSNSLTGNSKTVLCVNVSPCTADYDESFSSLLLGVRAKDIVTAPSVRCTRERGFVAPAAPVPTPTPLPTPPPSRKHERDCIDLLYESEEEEEEEEEETRLASVDAGVPADMLAKERAELAQLLAGTATGAKMGLLAAPGADRAQQRCLSLSTPADVQWIERELSITSKFTGIIRHLETVVAEQNVLIAKLARR